ncbi:PREDICTED: DNA polymerase epsilon catalytic subunit A-like [Nicotiana attenuata]|uniref:DNA polymerase epsilon catalytic subunit n=1 Tax=Nicotiana attenuata TaxID=49451 RepID=A0A1J6KI26_NICAT|nr:PREDICTED: DNA polymerase epsilon catalytic subunit A-like [Nicotiana attenuata]OIT28308.1 dna polymerase epsilon catalytic subunit a [Nicotiana attenuata]
MNGGGDNRRRDWRDTTRISKKQKLILSSEEQLECKLGFDVFTEGDKRLGWLLTLASSSWEDQETRKVYSCVDLYFVCQDGSTFKAKYKFRPYFYVATKDKMEMDVEAYLRRRYESQIADIEILEKEDLDLKNHLSGLRRLYLKISFDTVQQLMHVKRDLTHIVERNQTKFDTIEAYESILTGKSKQRSQDFIDYITDLREYDVPYHVRYAIDNDVRCGQWYDVSVSSSGVMLEKRTDLLQRAEVHVCAFDIETTKLPLKFPDAEYDSVMMISYMVDGQGYLIINRECVAEDIEDIEYTPKPEYEGHFKVTNVKNEEGLLRHWFAHMQVVKPGIYVTYNGDFFDWPFLETRATHFGLSMKDELGFSCDKNQGECRAKFACHLDCFAWVKRDSYLPQGSQGLKAVTKAKLGYDPLEVNPEDMVRFAMEKPQMMASYSVSDAVSTYYLYMTYVHPFIFSLATIIPMPPDEVLRKGSGTLCEMLLMVQAYKANVICPNKHQSDPEKFYGSQLLESETYIGGHVECLESGVFRSDLPTSFKLDPSAYELLINNLDRDLQYAIVVEGKMDLESVINYDEVKNAVMEKLMRLRDNPLTEECPLIYHLDVAAMYPNIILTNRLQPPSIVSDEICTACDFNRPGKKCLRKLEWVWRGETYMAKRSDYYHIKRQLESELVEVGDGQRSQSFLDLPKADQQAKLKDRLKKYCQKAYKRVLEKPVTELREAGICMRENPFYVDTVRSFRDRRYEYKGLNKAWKGKLSEAKASGNSIKIQEAQDMVVLYDSLQLAHKCILNSFYGYVMRKGARWYSMEMAGVVTYTGAKIIQNARLLVEKIGKPLELDTDGIWCALPGSFPENYTFKTKDPKKKLTISYPCVMLNVDVARNNTNDQYQTLKDPINKTYTTHSECSIEFEVDGPYKAMILPASKEEGILIKKRYAVFNDDGTLAELKGFEIKRRGELKLIKVFQAELFDKFLHGSTLEECYSVVASVADRWLDLLDNQGNDIADSELLDYISESSTMSKSLADYGEQKSCAVTTAKRLADFLGDAMVKDKGLRCQYIVACEPKGTPVSERAIPVAIFETNAEIMRFYVKKWCKISSEVGIRSIIDWSYYKQRLSSAIQKIITIPAAMQKVSNPVPRVVHPEWLHKKVREKEDRFRQRKLNDIFSSVNRDDAVPSKNSKNQQNIEDLEDFRHSGKSSIFGPRPVVHRHGVNKDHPVNTSDQVDNQQQSVHASSLCKMLPSQEIAAVEDIDRNVDYHGWLQQKKRKWKEIREGRKRQRLDTSRTVNHVNGSTELSHHTVNHKRQGRTGVNSYFERHELALTRSHWQIVQLEPTSQHGQFFAWVVVEGAMHKISVTIPRVFYLNSKAPITEEFPGRRVNKILPHGRHSYNLIEVIIDEDQFKSESKKLAAHLADPEVEGIYETKVPLEFSAILQMGCVCKVDKAAKKRNPQDGWSLSELHMKTTTECPYLDQSITFFYLYHSLSDGRAIYVGYFPSSKMIHVVVVNPFQNKELSPHILERHYYEACQTLSGQPITQKEGISFKVDYVKHIKEAERILQRIINEHRHHGPAVAMIECPDAHSLKSGIRALDDFPCISIPCNARDSQYQALGWQNVAAKIGMQRCVTSSQWLNERITLSRYAHVPIGNFDVDWLMHTADIFFSRALRDQQQVLWISDNGIPDLGGVNDEVSSFMDEVNQPVLTYPGAYRKVTVELKIHHLAVDALLKSNQVNEMEGGTLFGLDQDLNSTTNFTNDNYCFDATTSCAPAFRVLKQLIQRCLTDAVTSGNIFADAMLQHLYRWLCSPRSRLHDPALHSMLHKVMQKMFALLVAELRKLGAAIVFASFSKIIIDTGKSDVSAARAYCDSVIKTVQNRELFEWIELEPLQFWHSLLFMDQYNYGGIQARLSDGPLEVNSEPGEESVCGESQVDIVSSWNIAENLPKATQDHFILIVSEFMYIPWKFAQEQATHRASSSDGDLCTPSITAALAETFDLQMAENLKKKIRTYFTDKLLKIVCDPNLQMKVMNNSQKTQETSDANSQSYSHVQKGDPALEFIKHVCAVLALDQNVQHEVLIMRRNLLKLVRVREFAPEAEFHSLSVSYTLPNVICSYCNDCRDLDLCRDRALISQEWRCAVPQCGQPYDREAMENALIQIVRQRERLYHLQDLVCLKCHQIKAAHLADHCTCAGSFSCKEGVSEFCNKMQVFFNIAVNQKFQLLQECTSWILEAR